MFNDGFVVERLTAPVAVRHLAGFIELLREAVDDGASVGFVSPLDAERAQAYWVARIAEVEAGRRVLLVAWLGTRMTGTVQLALESQPNGMHRGEVQRLLVRREARRLGLGTLLMRQVEEVARQSGRTLLILNTRSGDAPARLYERLGYMPVGEIPDFARNPDGSFNTTCIFYRKLS